MKTIAAYAALFIMAFGLTLGFTALSANAGNAPYCNMAIYEPFEWCSAQTGSPCSDPTPYKLYQCLGRYSGSHIPCECTLIGCCSDPD
jgi:hypothetical protein